jgi:hypothetical protein
VQLVAVEFEQGSLIQQPPVLVFTVSRLEHWGRSKWTASQSLWARLMKRRSCVEQKPRPAVDCQFVRE